MERNTTQHLKPCPFNQDVGVRLSPLGNHQCLAYVYRCRHHRLFRRYGHLCSNSHIDLSGSGESIIFTSWFNDSQFSKVASSPIRLSLYKRSRTTAICTQPVLPVGRILLFHSIHGVIPFHGLVSLLGLGRKFHIRMQPCQKVGIGPASPITGKKKWCLNCFHIKQ